MEFLEYFDFSALNADIFACLLLEHMSIGTLDTEMV